MASGSTSGGRLNNVGISASSTEYVGFSKCLDLEESGTYYIGIGADNYCRFKVNGVLYANFSGGGVPENFKIWSVFPFELAAGLNIIEIEGLNVASTSTAFGVEIYKPSNLATLSASTTTGTTGLVFSSKDKIGDRFDLGTTFGYTCPSGYAVNTCDTGVTCTSISKTECSGETINMTSGSTGVYIISTATTIPLTFNFTSNTDTFTATSATFKYEIYKYSSFGNIFIIPPVYKSDTISYSAFSGTNILTQSIPVSGLTLDGDYIVKGYYEFNACTDFLSRLGKRVDTVLYKGGDAYQLYDDSHDYYLVALTQAAKPRFIASDNSTVDAVAPLFQETLFVDDADGPTNTVVVAGEFASDLIITVNGAVLSLNDDYTYSGNVVSLSGSVTSSDVVTAIYNRTGGINIVADTINVVTTIPSGTTGNQGFSQVYYNTTTGKYEVFTDVNPVVGSDILVIINTVTLASGIDYYQSTSDPKRIILEGTIVVGDTISIVYYPQASVVNGINASSKVIVWMVDEPPQAENGRFVIELSSASTFNTLTYTAETPYQINVGVYNGLIQMVGSVGTKMYYRVKNEKSYLNLCGEIIRSDNYSETIPVTITTNSLNSY
jgi:hypothetical protein